MMLLTTQPRSTSNSVLRRSRIFLTMLFSTQVMLGFGSVASANEIRVATGLPAPHGISTGSESYKTYVEENSESKMKIFHLSLLKLNEIPDGLRDGVINMGTVVSPYKPVEYSEFNLVADLSMLSTSGNAAKYPASAVTGAMMDYVHHNCPDCVAQFEGQNQVFLGANATEPYTLLCTSVLDGLASFKGKKFRSGAANFGRWAESVGGIKVQMPGNEIYDAMSQGVVDCAMLSASTLIEQSLSEVTKQIIFGVPGGVFSGLADNNVNKDYWQSLSPDMRAVLMRGTSLLSAAIVMAQADIVERGMKAGEESGLLVTQADEETMAAYSDFVNGDVAVISQQFEEKFGLNNVGTKIETFKDLLAKWKNLTDPIGYDLAALEQLYWDEVLSKVDLTVYGLN